MMFPAKHLSIWLAFSSLIVSAPALAAGADATECGREGQKPCSWAPAIRVQRPWSGRSCGEFEGRRMFLSKRNGGECWSCEASYKRSKSSVIGAKACIRRRGGKRDLQPALYHKGIHCPFGAFLDKRGGYCMKCPQNFKKVKTVGGNRCKRVRKCRVGFYPGRKNGHRTCKAIFPWKGGRFGAEPGLFGMIDPRAHKLLNGLLVTYFIAKAARQARNKPADLRRAAIHYLEQLPMNKGLQAEVRQAVFYTMVLAGQQAAAFRENPRKNKPPSPAVLALVSGFKKYVRRRHMYLSRGLEKTYREWEAEVLARRARGSRLATMAYLGDIPPPLEDHVLLQTRADLQAKTFLAHLTGSLNATAGVASIATGAYFLFEKAVVRASSLARIRGEAVSIAKAASLVIRNAGVMAASGLLILVDIIAIVVGILGQIHLDKLNKAHKKIRDAIKELRRPVEMNELLTGRSTAYAATLFVKATSRPITRTEIAGALRMARGEWKKSPGPGKLVPKGPLKIKPPVIH